VAIARGAERAETSAGALVRASAAGAAARRKALDRLALALAAHDPARTLERGYALVEDPDGAPVTSAATARERARLVLRMHDGRVPVTRREGEPDG